MKSYVLLAITVLAAPSMVSAGRFALTPSSTPIIPPAGKPSSPNPWAYSSKSRFGPASPVHWRNQRVFRTIQPQLLNILTYLGSLADADVTPTVLNENATEVSQLLQGIKATNVRPGTQVRPVVESPDPQLPSAWVVPLDATQQQLVGLQRLVRAAYTDDAAKKAADHIMLPPQLVYPMGQLLPSTTHHRSWVESHCEPAASGKEYSLPVQADEQKAQTEFRYLYNNPWLWPYITVSPQQNLGWWAAVWNGPSIQGTKPDVRQSEFLKWAAVHTPFETAGDWLGEAVKQKSQAPSNT